MSTIDRYFYTQSITDKNKRKSWSFIDVSSKENTEFLELNKIGKTLNICCGYSTVGDILIDIDRKVIKQHNANTFIKMKKDVIVGDLFHIPIRENVIETVICDPPYSYYNKFTWINYLANLKPKRIILSVPTINIHIKNYKREIWAVCAPNRLFLILWFIFDKR